MLSQRSSITKAAASGAIYGAADKFIAGNSLDFKACGVQAASSYVAPTVTDKVGPMIGVPPSAMYDAAAAGVIFATGAPLLGVYDGKSWLYRALYSAGSDFTADYVKGFLPQY